MIDRPAAVMGLGIDPGPTTSGWALIDFTIPSAPVWFEAGNTTRVESLFELLAQRDLARHVQFIAIEEARGRVDPQRAGQVLLTTWEAGRAAGHAEARGFRVIRMGATQWRRSLVGAPRAGDNVDHQVAHALALFVRHFPARSNVHVRDAAGIACVAARDWQHLLKQHQKDFTVTTRARRGPDGMAVR